MSTKKEVKWLTDYLGDEVKPMLADDYRTLVKKPSWLARPFFVQPKFDGYRCLVKVGDEEVRAVSRNGKPLVLTERLTEALDYLPPGVYDGELYTHGLAFGAVQSLITDVAHPEREERLVFVIFDIVSPLPFEDRLEDLTLDLSPGVEVAKTTLIDPSEDGALDRAREAAEADGYEGLILRDPAGRYEYKRTKSLLKLKSFFDEEFLVMDIFQGEGKNAGTAVLECWVDGDRYFTVTAPGTYDAKREVWENRDRYIGRKLTVRYQEKSAEGIPRFPVAVSFKEDR